MKNKIIFIFFLLVFCYSGVVESFQASQPQVKSMVGVVEGHPFAYKNDQGVWEGIAVDLWAIVAKNLGLDYEFVAVNKSDAAAAVVQGKVDFIVGDVSVSSEREKVIDFSQSYYASDLAMAVKKRPAHTLMGMLLKTFFSWQFFSIVAGLFLLLSIAGGIIWHFERKHNTDFSANIVHGIVYAIYWVSAMMTGTGERTPRSVYGKVFGIIWIFMGLFITSAFIASVTTILTAGHHVQQVLNERDLPSVRVGVVADTYAHYLRQIGSSVSVCPNVVYGLDKLRDGEIDVFMISEPVLRYYSGKIYHGLFNIIPISYEKVFFAFGMRPDNFLKESLNNKILETIKSPAWKIITNRYLNY